MNEEICCITNKGKTAKNELANVDSDFLQALYNLYRKLRTIFFPYLLICLNRDGFSCCKYFSRLINEV